LGGARAYAYVDNGQLDPARSFGVTSMAVKSVVNADIYCFVLNSTPVNVIVSRAQGSGNSGADTPTVLGTNAFSMLTCDGGTNAAVVNSISSGTRVTASFFALFY
jgi:hypothetical protein